MARGLENSTVAEARGLTSLDFRRISSRLRGVGMSLNQDALNQLRIDRSGSPPKSPWPVIGVVVLLGVGGAMVYGWKGLKRAAAVETAAAVEITGGAPQVALNASGYVTARREATVSSKVTGQILDVLFEEGQKVEAGQPLAHVDPSNLQTSLDLAKAQYEDARAALGETQAQLTQAESEFERVSALASNRIASGSDLDKARADAESLRARLAREQVEITVAEKQVATWQQQVDDTVIRAPFAGVIVSKDAQPGEIISPLSAGGSFTRTGIGTVVDMSSLEIEVDVNENYINRVEAGQKVDAVLDAYADWHLPCKVIAIIPTADRQKGTVKVRIGFDKLDPRILPDMGVKVSFESTTAQARSAAGVRIPGSAVRSENDQSIVLVARNGRAERRAVKIGERQNENAVVESGLTAGERVILNAPADLKDGDPIQEKQP